MSHNVFNNEENKRILEISTFMPSIIEKEQDQFESPNRASDVPSEQEQEQDFRVGDSSESPNKPSDEPSNFNDFLNTINNNLSTRGNEFVIADIYNSNQMDFNIYTGFTVLALIFTGVAAIGIYCYRKGRKWNPK